MNNESASRRDWLKGAFSTSLGICSAGRSVCLADDQQPFVRTITKGPKFHWFGYYDKLQVDPSGRYVLGMEVEFEHRSPKPDDVVKVGMVDLQDGDRWIELGRTTAWCWQQGCMLQWLPGSASKILWNDREGGRYVGRILDVKSNEQRTIPSAVYTVSPNGKTAATCDFRRLQNVRPGYGYVGIPDPSTEDAPTDSGIWTVDLESGKVEMILSVAEVAKFGTTTDDMKGARHWFNHLLFNTDGTRLVFLHRWRPLSEKRGGFRTRMITARADGSGLYVLDPSGNTSHFIWRDERTILAWTKPFGKQAGFYLFNDLTGELEQVGKGIMTENGHCTYLPGNQWILNDTYPDKSRLQHVYLYHVESGKRVPLGSFLSRKEYTGEWRCDTHPRFSPDGKFAVIDSPHQGGRQMHLIDVSRIVKS